MSQGNPFRHKKRFHRIMHLLQRVRSATLPVINRHNRVVFFRNGQDFFAPLLTAIRAAQAVILVEYYMIKNDATGATFAAELIAAADRGVRVMLIYDYIGCVETPSAFFKALISHGIQVIPFNVPSFRRGICWFDRRDHRKMTIIDGQTAFLGGFNIGDEYAGLTEQPQRFRDMGFCIEGSAVSELIRIFEENWQMEMGHRPAIPLQAASPGHRGRASVIIVSGGPHQRGSYIRGAFLVNIAAAAEDLMIVNPYFVPGPRIIRSLLRAAKRGVRVRLLLPARSDVRIVQIVGRSSYDALLRGGVEVYELEQEILHAKVMLVDGERTVIGSANFDQRSFHRNFEINAVIDSRVFGGQIRRQLEIDFAGSKRIDLQEHHRRGLMMRILERLFNLFGWFL